MRRLDKWRSVKHVQGWRRRKVTRLWDIKFNHKLNYDKGLQKYRIQDGNTQNL